MKITHFKIAIFLYLTAASLPTFAEFSTRPNGQGNVYSSIDELVTQEAQWKYPGKSVIDYVSQDLKHNLNGDPYWDVNAIFGWAAGFPAAGMFDSLDGAIQATADAQRNHRGDDYCNSVGTGWNVYKITYKVVTTYGDECQHQATSYVSSKRSSDIAYIFEACNCGQNDTGSGCVPLTPLNSWDVDYEKGESFPFPENNHDMPRCSVGTSYVESVNSCPQGDSSTLTGNPIDCATGQKKYFEVDYQGFGLNPIQIRRRYESQSTNPEVRWQSPYWLFDKPTLTHLGFVPIGNIDLGYVYRFDIGDRYSRTFILQSEVGQTVRNDILQNNPNPDLFEVRYQESKIAITVGGSRTYVFDEDRKISEIQSANGQLLYRYVYNSDTNPKVIRIENAQQRHVDFAYNPQGNLESLTDQDGHQINYEYDATSINKLVKVTYPDGTPADPTDNPFKQYLYEDTSATKITGIVDQDGTRVASIAYGADGKATVSELWNGAERVEVSYPSSNESLVKFFRDTDTNAYREERYTFEKIVGQYKLTSKAIIKCENCALTTESWAYHSGNGQKSKHISPAGIETRWHRDQQGRLTSKVEAAGTLEEQTTTYTWNDTHNQIETITTATEVITHTFDADGNITQTQTTPAQ